MSGRTTAFAVLGLLLVALGLRWLHAQGRESVWRDEVQDLHLTAGDGPLRERLRHEGHPPVHYFLERAVHGDAADDPAHRRLLPVLFGTLSVLALVLLTRSVFGNDAALLAGLFGTAMPFLVFYSGEIRAYALYGLLALVQALAYVRFLKRPSIASAAVWGGLAAVAALTHYYALFLVLGGGVYALLRDPTRANFGNIAVAGFAFLVTFSPWAGVFVTHITHDLQPWYEPRRRPADIFVIFGLPFGKWGLPIALWALVATFVRFRPDPDRRDLVRGLFWMGFGGSLAAVIVQQSRGPFVPRYLIGHLLVLMPLFAPSWAALFRDRSWKRAAAAGVAVVALVMQQSDAGHWTGRKISGARTAAEHVARHERPTDAVWIILPFFTPAFRFAYSGALEPVSPPYGKAPDVFDWAELPRRYLDPDRAVHFQNRLRAHLEAGHRVWLVVPGGYPFGSDWAAETEPVDSGAPLIRTDLEQYRRILRLLYRRAEDVYLWHAPADAYHEALTLALFDPEVPR